MAKGPRNVRGPGATKIKMKHILTNPHNGANVDHEGVKLAPGQELHVQPNVGEALIKRFGFLLLRVVPGDDKAVKKAKPVKVKGLLEWKHEVAPDENPAPYGVQHVVASAAKKSVAAKKKSAKK